MGEYEKQQLCWVNYNRNTSYLLEEPCIPTSSLSKQELELKYKDFEKYLAPSPCVDRIAEMVGDWRITVDEAVEAELGDYLQTVYEIDRKRLEKYIRHCNNVKVKGANLHSITSPQGTTEWYDGDTIIFTSGQHLNGTVYEFGINSHWRKG